MKHQQQDKFLVLIEEKTAKELIHVEERNDLIVLKRVQNSMKSLMHDLA